MQTGEARAREAALLLHGLGSKQRAAVLARLAPGHLAELQPLLEELATLGIPPSLARVQARAMTRAGVMPGAPQGRGDASPSPAIATPEPHRAGRVLRACAAATVAAVLRDAPPEWRQLVLAELPRDRRRDVAERLDRTPPLPRRVAEALRRRLEEEVAGPEGAGRTVSMGPRGWKRWLPWTR